MKFSAKQWAIVEMPNKSERLVHLKPGSSIDLGRYGKFLADELFNLFSGSYFEVMSSAKLSPISPRDVDAMNISVPTDATGIISYLDMW